MNHFFQPYNMMPSHADMNSYGSFNSPVSSSRNPSSLTSSSLTSSPMSLNSSLMNLSTGSNDSGYDGNNSLYLDPQQIEDLRKRKEEDEDTRSFFPDLQNIDENEAFESVSARTALLSDTKKYKVTNGEIIRRISSPECCHLSLVNAILRKAKAKDGGKELGRKLASKGIHLPAGRRKALPNTCFTALCEDEAVKMAQDLTMLCNKEFKSPVFARQLMHKKMAEGADMRREKEKMEHVREFLNDMQMFFNSIGNHPKDFKQYPDPSPIQKEMFHFSQVTHGFGPHALFGVAQAMSQIATESVKLMNGGVQAELPAVPKFDAPINPMMQYTPQGFMGFHQPHYMPYQMMPPPQ